MDELHRGRLKLSFSLVSIMAPWKPKTFLPQCNIILRWFECVIWTDKGCLVLGFISWILNEHISSWHQYIFMFWNIFAYPLMSGTKLSACAIDVNLSKQLNWMRADFAFSVHCSNDNLSKYCFFSFFWRHILKLKSISITDIPFSYIEKD